MKRTLIIAFILLTNACKLLAQQTPVLTVATRADELIDQIGNNPAINADSAFTLFSNWSNYPVIEQTGRDYLYYYTDSLFGKIPLRIYIPASYNNTIPNTCILLLHGAVGGSKFSNIDTASKFDDLIFGLLKNRNDIIIRPVADPSKKFDWIVDRFESNPNLTFKVIADILRSVKKVINIDNNKVFAFGHSDGSDGSVGLAVYAPNQFAGIIAYNSMLNNIFATDFYIRNIINTPLYVVHSSLDDLRPIEQNRIIINELNKIDRNIIYKEYIGYQHYDKHLNKDIPYTQQFINSVSRNPFKTHIYWETASADIYNACDWLKITAVSNPLIQANWHKPFNVITYNKIDKKFNDSLAYYTELKNSAAVEASYNNNIFTIQTSGVAEFEILISPVMVNMEQPIIVNVNGKQIFGAKVIADKKFITNGFKSDFDKDAIWITSLKLKVN
jgi:predicted esterase